MNKRSIPPSELVLDPNGAPYHIGVKSENLSTDIVLVGDQERVEAVSKFFSSIEHEHQNREFRSATGLYNGKRISVLSTGIGTDNVDIVVNELDAAFNIDLESRQEKDEKTSLNLLRLGTSGSLQPEIDVDSFVCSAYAIGLDNVLHYYEENIQDHILTEHVRKKMGQAYQFIKAYGVKGSSRLLQRVGDGLHHGITLTASGFYGPQGRELRLAKRYPELNVQLSSIEYDKLKVTNYEMETSALFALGGMLGHNCMTICLIIANRFKGAFSENYKEKMNELIEQSLDRLTAD